MAHIRMMGAAQPFLSGAISKTVNLPSEATLEDVTEIYMEGWKLNLKAIALYRDGCKSSQPLNTKDDEQLADDEEEVEEVVAAAPTRTSASMPAPFVDEGLQPPPTVRHRLPKKRAGYTTEAKVGGHKVFLRTGEYNDGSIGEIFIDMHKEGASFRSLMNSFAISVSMGLQHGVPLESYVEQFTFTRFEPAGPVSGHPNIKFATSMIDYIFRVLGVDYLKRYDFAHVPPVEVQEELSNPTDVTAAHQAQKAAAEAGMVAPPDDDRQVELFEAVGNSAPTNVNEQLSDMMGDAPVCDTCGHTTVRNGACYRCLNCGASMGCS